MKNRISGHCLIRTTPRAQALGGDIQTVVTVAYDGFGYDTKKLCKQRKAAAEFSDCKIARYAEVDNGNLNKPNLSIYQVIE
jgi:hypothetical protein